eukprot:6485661-Amphidinium_carterae.3
MESHLKDVASLLERMRHHGKPSNPAEDRTAISVIVEAAHEGLKQRMAEEELAARGQPLLRYYASDCTPVIVQRSAVHGTVEGAMRRRRRKKCDEFLLEVLYQRRLVGEESSDSILIAPPQHLSHGKTGIALHSCAEAFVGKLVPSFMQHEGIIVFFTSFDRPSFAQLSQSLIGLAQQQFLQDLEEDKHRYGSLAAELFFAIAAPCSLHDAHNAAKWGVTAVCPDRDLWKQLYIAVSSSRNMALELAEVTNSWLETVVSYTYVGVPGSRCAAPLLRNARWKCRVV